jgi:hypothetical protein
MPGTLRRRVLLAVAVAVMLSVFDGGKAGAMLRLYPDTGSTAQKEKLRMMCPAAPLPVVGQGRPQG